MSDLVLSIFPGIDLLGLAFEQEGFTVVRGPDPIFGGDVKTFHPPAGVFAGVIGGPPCQVHSAMRSIQPNAGAGHGDLIPEFCRVVAEARPRWFLMENVPGATVPEVPGYRVAHLELDNRWLGEAQRRRRRFSFGTPEGASLLPHLEVAPLESPVVAPAVLAGHGASRAQRLARGGREVSVAEMCEWQGLPAGFADELPFSMWGKRKVIGNGVPLPMGRTVARAVKRTATVSQ